MNKLSQNSLFIQQPESFNNGPFSAPPGKTAPAIWQTNRCHSLPENNLNLPLDQDPNALYDNYPPSAVIGEPPGETGDKDLQRPSSPPQPPERKFLHTDNQLVVKFNVSLFYFK